VLTREIGELKKVGGSSSSNRRQPDDRPCCCRGPLQTVAAVEALDQKCGDLNTKQFLASIGPWLVAYASACYSNDGSIIEL